MCLRGKPFNPLTTGAIINFKRQDGQYESDYNVGKAVIYGRDFLRQLPRTLRRRVLVALTDFHNISLIIVTLGVDAQGAETLSTEMSEQLPKVKQTLLQLLSCEPQRWYVDLPDLGPSIQVVGLLGFGATSHVYEASERGHQVMALTLSYVAVLTMLLLSFKVYCILYSTHSACELVMTAGKSACGHQPTKCLYLVYGYACEDAFRCQGCADNGVVRKFLHSQEMCVQCALSSSQDLTHNCRMILTSMCC